MAAMTVDVTAAGCSASAEREVYIQFLISCNSVVYSSDLDWPLFQCSRHPIRNI